MLNFVKESWFKTQHSENEDHGIWSHQFMANRWANNVNSDRQFSWAPKSVQMVTAAMNLRHFLLGRKVMSNLDSILKSRDITLPTKAHLVKVMVFPVILYGCESDYKESWVLKNWYFWTVVLEKTLGSPLNCKGVQPVHPKGDQASIFIGNTDTEAETAIIWPPNAQNWLIERFWCWERSKAGGEGDNRGWDGWMASPTPGVGDEQGSLTCCSPWGHKESDTTEWLKWLTDKYF